MHKKINPFPFRFPNTCLQNITLHRGCAFLISNTYIVKGAANEKKVKCVELVTDILDMVLTLSLKTEWGGGKGEVTVLKKKTFWY